LILIRTSPGRLVLGNPEFVKQFLRDLAGEARAHAVTAFVENAHSLGSGGFAGDPNQTIQHNRNAIAGALSVFERETDMQDLCAALATNETPQYGFGSHFGLQGPTG